MTAIANPGIGMEFDPSMGLYLPEANPAPIGAVNVMDQPDPLALDAREQAIVDSWGTADVSTAEKVVTEYGSVEEIVSAEGAEELEAAAGMKEDAESGLILPVAKAEETEKRSGFFSGLKDKASNFISKHPKIAKAAAAAGVITTLAAAAPADAHASWTVLGGDPLVPGGVQTRADFVRLMTSQKGKTAMHYAGLNNKEIHATVVAAREGKEYRCDMPYGEMFQAMSFGINGTSVDRHVRFADPDYIGDPANAWCMDVPVDLNGDGKIDEKLHEKVPFICGNFGLVSVERVKHPHHPKKPHHPHGSVSIVKYAENAQGILFPHTPSGTFQFDASCVVRGSGRVHDKIVYNPDAKNDPVTVLRGCKVGSVAIVRELTPLGDDEWQFLTPPLQKQVVRKGGNVFSYKDRQVAPVIPTTPNQPTPVCTDTQPAVNCVPKDGSQGPGTTVPGQPGGGGSGGEGNPSQNSIACYDTASSTDGDLDPSTEGATMWGTAKDQFDNCVGPATPA